MGPHGLDSRSRKWPRNLVQSFPNLLRRWRIAQGGVEWKEWTGNSPMNCHIELKCLAIFFRLNSALRNKNIEYMRTMLTSPDVWFLSLNIPSILYHLLCNRVQTPRSPGPFPQVTLQLFNVLLKTCYLDLNPVFKIWSELDWVIQGYLITLSVQQTFNNVLYCLELNNNHGNTSTISQHVEGSSRASLHVEK